MTAGLALCVTSGPVGETAITTGHARTAPATATCSGGGLPAKCHSARTSVPSGASALRKGVCATRGTGGRTAASGS